MYTITTTFGSTASGATTVTAKGHGKQRTIRPDLARSPRQAHGDAAGTLLNVLLDSRQQAKVRHPSGDQRVTIESLTDAGGKMRFSVEV